MHNNASRPASCRVCGSSRVRLCLQMDNVPPNISRILRPEEVEAGFDRPVSLEVYECQACGLVQLGRALESTFYDDYLMTVSHSPQMRAYQKGQATDFVGRFALTGKRVIEVGCGDGTYLEYLHEAGARVVGMEPSAVFRRLAESRGMTVIPGYVAGLALIQGAPYEGFVTRQVLEHVQDPNDFLETIRVNLCATAAGIVEVPSMEQALEHDRFYDFFPDHMSYFSARTLRMVLERNGFDVVEVTRGMNGEFNVALVRASRPADVRVAGGRKGGSDAAPVGSCSPGDFRRLQSAVNGVCLQLRQLVEKSTARGLRVAFWGAGGKGLTAMAVAKVKGISYVVDSDPHKQGGLTPVMHLPIVSPAHLRDDPVDVVIITALAYKDEILSQLREDIRFTGTVAVLGPSLEIVHEARANE